MNRTTFFRVGQPSGAGLGPIPTAVVENVNIKANIDTKNSLGDSLQSTLALGLLKSKKFICVTSTDSTFPRQPPALEVIQRFTLRIASPPSRREPCSPSFESPLNSSRNSVVKHFFVSFRFVSFRFVSVRDFSRFLPRSGPRGDPADHRSASGSFGTSLSAPPPRPIGT